MKKTVLFLLMLFLSGSVAFAQRGLHCYPVFRGKVVPVRQMVVTEVRGEGMNTYKLDYYRGVKFHVDTTLALQVAEMVESDAVAATSVEIERVGGFLTYALIQPKPSGNTNRYLCYHARPVRFGWDVTLLYLEGSATLEDLRSMFDKQSNDKK